MSEAAARRGDQKRKVHMFKIWKGLGFFVLFIAAGCVFGGMLLTNKFGGESYWNHNSWPAAATLVAAGVVCWFLGRKLNKPARADANPQRPWTHDLFFVRMEMWAFPLAAL